MSRSTRGQHLIAEYWQCQGSVLNDLDAIEALMKAGAVAAGATIVRSTFHRFAPNGVSGVVVIQESHLSVHTWPEKGYAAIDFYTCGDCDPRLAHEVLVAGLAAASGELLILERGVGAVAGLRGVWDQSGPVLWEPAPG
ncbi:MAG: S-adenosylmethionine decarboxylase proenzyme [Myxococcota bacterium]